MRRMFEGKARPIPITGIMVEDAYKKVKATRGSAGIDKISLPQFEERLSDNLYKICNRLSSGSYFPPAVVISPLLANLYLHYSKLVGELRNLKFDRWAKSWQDIVDLLNDKIRGWVQYYDKFRYRTLTIVFHRLHYRLTKWIVNRFKRF